MSNQNNVPTAPGWHYRQTPRGLIEPVRVDDFSLSRVFTYQWAGSAEVYSVEDDGLWLGPVPMPGEWVPMDLADRMSNYVASVEDGRTGMEILGKLADYKNLAKTP